MTIVKGDAGGIFIRRSSQGGYIFDISQNGSYALRVDFTIIQSGSSSAIKVGLNQSNLIAIAAHGNTLDLFVNKQYITSVNDSSYSEGGIGILAHAISKPTEVEYRNAMVWIL
jgi:eukaryotic-like serine/threonine-protein kinase